MQEIKILKMLNENEITTMSQLTKELQISSRAVRSLLKNLKDDGAHHGFGIETIRSKGYKLMIENEELFYSYVEENSDGYVGHRQTRIPRILYFLLQQNDYISVQTICDLLQISRNTLLKDLKYTKDYLTSFSLELESKSHYGIKINGNEKDMRKAFSKFVVNSKDYTMGTQQYFEFIENLDLQEFEIKLKELIEKESLMITQQSLDSIIDHLKVLLFRVSHKNYISEMSSHNTTIEESYYSLSKEITNWLQVHYCIEIPQIEIEYLTSQIAGKTSVAQIPEKHKEKLEHQITNILKSIDEEFITDFENDEILKEALLMHMYPLSMRIAHKIELDNPLVDFVSSRYANVFLVALKFLELWNRDYEVDLSQDEVGYMALHFAGHLERRKQKAIASYKRILIVSQLGRGNVLLIRQKLEEVFVDSVINYDYLDNEEEINRSGADLVLSTIPLNENLLEIPLIYIKELLTDKDIAEIKDILIIKTNIHKDAKRDRLLYNLFDQQLFEIVDESDYLMTINKLANKMVTLGYAADDFPDSVIEREKKFTTIYENGIAGPHSMNLNAKQESIGVSLIKRSMMYQDKEVSIIFLINIYKGNLFLYREISKFLQSIINDYTIISKLENVKNYEEFKEIIETVTY